MKKHIALWLLLPVPLGQLGCAGSPTLREGIWELSYVESKRRDRLNPTRDGRPFPIEPVLVKVTLGPATDGSEIAQIDAVEAPPAAGTDESPEGRPKGPVSTGPALTPMFADIRPRADGNPTIHIEHQDATWTWRMGGVIVSPEQVDGTYFSALQRRSKDLGAEGRWRMRWVEER
jgi:hypothetical protein